MRQMVLLVKVLLLCSAIACLGNVKIETIYIPCGNTAEYSSTGDEMSVSYTAYIDESSQTGTPGTIVDTTAEEIPLVFALGSADILTGFNMGLHHMCIGEYYHDITLFWLWADKISRDIFYTFNLFFFPFV